MGPGGLSEYSILNMSPRFRKNNTQPQKRRKTNTKQCTGGLYLDTPSILFCSAPSPSLRSPPFFLVLPTPSLPFVCFSFLFSSMSFLPFEDFSESQKGNYSLKFCSPISSLPFSSYSLPSPPALFAACPTLPLGKINHITSNFNTTTLTFSVFSSFYEPKNRFFLKIKYFRPTYGPQIRISRFIFRFFPLTFRFVTSLFLSFLSFFTRSSAARKVEGFQTRQL